MEKSYHQCAHPECTRRIISATGYCRNHYPPPTYVLSDGLVKVVLSKGIIVLIDEVDMGEITPMHWYCNARGYAVREAELGRIFGKSITEVIFMHRAVMENVLNRCLSDGEVVDHKDGDTLNNRRSNLRLSTVLQNRLNSKKRGDKTSSQYKGVHWHKHGEKWSARITVNKRQVSLGYFLDEHKAAFAYNEAARKYFGEFARLNEIEREGVSHVQ